MFTRTMCSIQWLSWHVSVTTNVNHQIAQKNATGQVKSLSDSSLNDYVCTPHRVARPMCVKTELSVKKTSKQDLGDFIKHVMT